MASRQIDTLGVIGLGRMGGGIASNGLGKGLKVIGYSPLRQQLEQLAQRGLTSSQSLEDLVQQLPRPRVILIYVPHGQATEQVCDELRGLTERGDIVVDGGNSHWDDSRRRHGFFEERGVYFLDAGTSGGLLGALQGACFMVGGEREAYERVLPVLRALAVDDQAVVYTGPSGSGHFVKLVHNAIEFGMVQAIGEGVEMLDAYDAPLNLPAVFDNWMHGSVIRSWLVELMGNALARHPNFSELATYVEDTGEVKWVLNWALERDIPSPVVSASQTALMLYRDWQTPASRAVALLRNQYGGHPVHRIGDPLPMPRAGQVQG